MKQAKRQKKLARRIRAYEMPQSDRFAEAKREGGAKCPGSNK